MLQSTTAPGGARGLWAPKNPGIPMGWGAAPRTVLKEDSQWLISGRCAQGRNSQCQGSEGTVRTKPKLLAWEASHR